MVREALRDGGMSRDESLKKIISCKYELLAQTHDISASPRLNTRRVSNNIYKYANTKF